MTGTDRDRPVSRGGTALALAAAIAAAGMFGGGMPTRADAGPADRPKQEATLKTRVIDVAPRPVEDTVTAAGTLASKNSSVLSSKIMGRVVHLGAQEGERVAAGKLLIRIDSGEITAQAVQAKAAYRNAKSNHDRIKVLFDAMAATQMEMDQAELGLETAQAALDAAKAMESYTHITAPISGEVVEKRINLGEMAMPGQPLMKIEDNRALRLEVTVKEQDVLQVRPGLKAAVQIDAMPGKVLNGTVAQVVPASDIRTHSFVVKVDIPAVPGLMSGMYGKAVFTTGKRQAIVVPRSAVVELSGITGVYRVTREGKASFQMVQLGAARGDAVEIVTGLAAGDRIVANGTLGRIEGRTITAE